MALIPASPRHNKPVMAVIQAGALANETHENTIRNAVGMAGNDFTSARGEVVELVNPTDGGKISAPVRANSRFADSMSWGD